MIDASFLKPGDLVSDSDHVDLRDHLERYTDIAIVITSTVDDDDERQFVYILREGEIELEFAEFLRKL